VNGYWLSVNSKQRAVSGKQ